MTEQRTEFSDLIRTRRAQLGLSLRDLAKDCFDPKTQTQLKFAWIGKVENKPDEIDIPSIGVLRAFAAGLKLPLRVLQEAAAAQFWGMTSVWSQDRSTRVLVADIESLPDEDQEQVAEIVESFARRRAQSDGNARD